MAWSRRWCASVWPELFRRLFGKPPDDGIRHHLVAPRVVMDVSEHEIIVPASRRVPVTPVLDGEEVGKQRDESLALAYAPFAPEGHLPRLHHVVRELCRPGIDDDAQRNAAARQLFP